MRKVWWMTAMLAVAGGAGAAQSDNPLLQDWDTPFATPPFAAVRIEHFEPAFLAAMQEHGRQIESIAADPAPASFANTIEALDAAGSLLERTGAVFAVYAGALTDEEVQAAAKRLAPLRSRHQDEILLDERLFARIRSVYDRRADLDLSREQQRLLEETHRRFVRGGAGLPEPSKRRLKEINEELSVLSLQFSENVLQETNRFALVVEDRAGLAGLPPAAIEAAAEEAARRDLAGRWAFTLDKPSLIPFLQFAEDREARRRLLTAYTQIGDHGDDCDNNAILIRTAALRLERARLLGFPSHAHYVLDDCMAKTPQAVYDFLAKIWPAARDKALQEAVQLQGLIDAEGGGFGLEPWDWWYYAEKLKVRDYALDESRLRPYFEMAKVRQGMFEVAGRLFGLSFTPRPDIPVYHPDVEAFAVRDAAGEVLAIWYCDYYPRPSKRGGAWMNSLRKQSYRDGARVVPLVYNVGNFTRPTAGGPSLLSVDEVKTMFHEFGHALHGMLSDCRYQSLSGTAVARDFVELPSQIMENWALQPDVLRAYARHHATGEPIPDELVSALQRSALFNQGFETTEYLAACYLDMDWHALTEPTALDAAAFEQASLARIEMPPQIVVRYRSPYFRHVFGGGYSAGYYSYVWAEVLDADAFEAFREAGDVFDPATAESFRRHVLAGGAAEDPMVLYERFRGRQPGIEPLLRRKGLLE